MRCRGSNGVAGSHVLTLARRCLNRGLTKSARSGHVGGVEPSRPDAGWAQRVRAWMLVGAVVCTPSGLGCQRGAAPGVDPGTVEPAPTAMPLLELQRVPEREQLLYRSDAPAAHGYGRGDLLGVFASVEGERDAVGYGHVTQVRGQTVELLATFLPDEHRNELRSEA